MRYWSVLWRKTAKRWDFCWVLLQRVSYYPQNIFTRNRSKIPPENITQETDKKYTAKKELAQHIPENSRTRYYMLWHGKNYIKQLTCSFFFNLAKEGWGQLNQQDPLANIESIKLREFEASSDAHLRHYET